MHHRVQKKSEENEAENLFEEIMAENFPNLGEGNKHPDPKGPESPKLNSKRPTPSHIIKILSTIKQKNLLKAVDKNNLLHRRELSEYY